MKNILCVVFLFMQCSGQVFFNLKRPKQIESLDKVSIEIRNLFKEVVDYINRHKDYPEQTKICLGTFNLKELMALCCLARSNKNALVEKTILLILDDKKYAAKFLQEFETDRKIRAFCGVSLLNSRNILVPKLLLHFKGQLISFSPNGAQVLIRESESEDIQLIDIKTEDVVHSFEDVDSVVYAPNGRQLAVMRDRSLVELWDATSTSMQGDLDFACSNTITNNLGSVISYSPDSTQLSLRGKNSIEIWDIDPTSTFTLLHSFDRGRNYECLYSPDGKKIVTKGANIRFWDAKTFKLIDSLECEKNSKILYSPDGTQFVTGETEIKVWDAINLSLVHTFKETERFVSLVYSPDSKQLILGNGKRSIMIYDAKDFSLKRVLTNVVQSPILYSPDSKYFVTQSFSFMSNIWDSSTFEMLHSFDIFDSGSIGFCSLNTLISQSSQKCIYSWESVDATTLGQFMFLICLNKFLIGHAAPLIFEESSCWDILLNTFDDATKVKLGDCCSVRQSSVLYDVTV